MSFVETRGATIYYGLEGSGPGLVFLHGGGGNATSWWHQIPHFAADFTCVTIDNRGFGRSYPAGPDVLDVDHFADDVLAVMDAADLDRAAVIGQSLGGWTGLRLALRHPERVWGFVGVSSPMGVDHPPALTDAMEFMRSLADSGLGIEDAALSVGFRQRAPDEYWLYRQLNAFNPLVLRGPEHGVPGSALVQAMFSPEIAIPLGDLAAVRVPSLLISGGQDRLVRTETMRVIADHLGDATLEVFDESGHSPYFEIPDRFNDLVGRWLRRVIDQEVP